MKEEAILAILRKHGEVTFSELLERVEQMLRGKFQGSISWYATNVKLDLEARKIILCTRGAGQQKVRLGKGK